MQDIFEQFRNFAVAGFPTVLDFPQWDVSAVYIVFCISKEKEIPIYVGETNSIRRRIGEYISTNFTMHTNFKVGNAIRYFQEKRYEVKVKYEVTEYRKEREDKIKAELQQAGYELLNDLKGYNDKTANEEEERQRVRVFCDDILRSDPNRTNS